MLEFIREVVETFVRLTKVEIDSGAVLVASDDIFEVTKVPSVVFQGPTLVEDGGRRTPAMLTKCNKTDLIFEQCHRPRLYHLDFDVIVTTGKEADLLNLTEKVARFYQLHPTFSVGNHGTLNITELVPLGGLKRVNLSNLRQSSGRCRIEDCPIYDGRIKSGKLATGLKIEINP